MKLVAFDLETTGTNPQTDQVLQIGMALFESTTGEVLDEFELLVRHDRYEGDPFALQMNAKLLRRLSEPGAGVPWRVEHLVNYGESHTSYPALRKVSDRLVKWGFNNPINPTGEQACAVGFNVGKFDLAFGFQKLFSRRSIELGTLLMPSFGSHDPVSSKEWHAFNDREVAHTALADCLEAVKAYHYVMEGIPCK